MDGLETELSRGDSMVINPGESHALMNPYGKELRVDKNAVLLSPDTTRKLLQRAGMQIKACESFMFIPLAFRISSAVDLLLGRSMLGGQYFAVGQKK